MTIQLVRKPPLGNIKSERLKITLDGRHTMKQKACMLLQVKFWLHQEHGIDNAGPTDVYLSLLDPAGIPDNLSQRLVRLRLQPRYRFSISLRG